MANLKTKITHEQKEKIRVSREWVAHRAERWGAFVKAHNAEIDSIPSIELEYLKKLEKVVAIAIQRLDPTPLSVQYIQALEKESQD